MGCRSRGSKKPSPEPPREPKYWNVYLTAVQNRMYYCIPAFTEDEAKEQILEGEYGESESDFSVYISAEQVDESEFEEEEEEGDY